MADNLEKIKCPACGKEMEKLYLPLHEFHVDICTQGCGGIFFDNQEFRSFDEYHENIDALKNALKDKEFHPVNDSEVRICPNCKIPMSKKYSSIEMTIQTDECGKCGGKFLDFGELEKIRDEYPTEEKRTEAFLQGLKGFLPRKKKKGFLKEICECIARIYW